MGNILWAIANTIRHLNMNCKERKECFTVDCNTTEEGKKERFSLISSLHNESILLAITLHHW